MTIHFRSRIQSPINYNNYLFPGTVGCCCTGPAGIQTSFFESTFGACNALGGYFKLSESGSCEGQCFPQGTTGCCCACVYAGMTEGIEKGKCEDLEGNWIAGECPEDENDICVTTDNSKDFSEFKKCCGYTLINGVTTPVCFSVCTEEECSKLTVGNLVSVYYPNSSCLTSPNCQGTQSLQDSPNNTLLTGNPEKDIYGNCCIQGIPCKCFEGINLFTCKGLNGSFYVLGEIDYPCSECLKNCTEGKI